MKRVIAVLVVLWVSLMAAPVWAEDINLSWANPTETFTLTPAGAYTNPAGTKIYLEVGDVADPVAEAFVLPSMKPGTYTFVAVSYDTMGVASPVSTSAEKVVSTFVTTAALVFYPVAQPNSVLMLGIGTVPLGTPCNPDVEVNGHYVVDRALVTWAGTAEPMLVVAQCG